MIVGIDSYSYHRFFGEIRPTESDHGIRWADSRMVVQHARSVGAECVYLETIFLPPPDSDTLRGLDSSQDIELGVSWHHPAGLAGPGSADAEDDLRRWIEEAAKLENRIMRITAGSPATREIISGQELCEKLVGPLRRASDQAASFGLSLALENHGDLNGHELHQVLDQTERANLGVCVDTVNALRLGDDVADFVALHAARTMMVQLKDCKFQEPYEDRPGGPVTTALGEGQLPLTSYLTTLIDVGFDGPVCVELATLGEGDVDELALIQRSVYWLDDYRSSQMITR